MTEPSGSSALSSAVASVSVALPVVGMETVRFPVVTPYSPAAAIVTLTASGEAGAGLAVSVKTALPPSVTALPAETVTSGSGAPSSSRTVTVAEDGLPLV